MFKISDDVKLEIENIKQLELKIKQKKEYVDSYFGREGDTEPKCQKELIYAFDKAIELAYRRGYAHGFSFGSRIDQDEIKFIEGKISSWRINLEDTRGAPGSNFENNTDLGKTTK